MATASLQDGSPAVPGAPTNGTDLFDVGVFRTYLSTLLPPGRPIQPSIEGRANESSHVGFGVRPGGFIVRRAIF